LRWRAVLLVIPAHPTYQVIGHVPRSPDAIFVAADSFTMMAYHLGNNNPHTN
jgi:hypothetical protein